MTTLRKTSGFTEVTPGDPGAPGYYRDVPAAYVESGSQCYASPVTVNAGTFRPLREGTRNVPAGATLVREAVGADSAGNTLYDVTGYYWTDTRVELRVQCLPTYATVYRREWVPPRPPTPASLRIQGSVGWTGGARSIGHLAGDGALSFKIPVGVTGVVCGLSDSDAGAGYREILYGLYCQHGSVQAISRGQLLGSAVSYADTTVLSVARTGGLILYMVGGYVAFATEEISGFSGVDLIADASLYAGNDSVVDAQFSGSVPTFTSTVTSNPTVNAPIPGLQGFASDVDSWLATQIPELSLKAGDPDTWLTAAMPELRLYASDSAELIYCDLRIPEFTLASVDGTPDLLPEYNAASGWLAEFTLDCIDITVERESPPALVLSEVELYSVSIGGTAGNDVAWLVAAMPEIVCAGYITDADSIYSVGSFSGFTAEVYINPVSLSVDITTGDAVGAAIFLSPPSLSISATTDDATCAASFRAGNGLTISATTADATCAAVFDAPPNLTISATTADATCVASFRAGNGLTISATTADATCAASFSVTAGIVINARTEDATCVASFYLTPQLTINVQLEDAVATSGATATYVYHPDHDSFTEYSGFGFNSYARIGGNYFAAGNNGLYQLGGDDDAGVDIQAYILTGMLDFGGHMMSRTPRMYFDFSGDSGLAVSVYTSTDGLRRTEAFTLSLPAAPVDRSACLPLGRGLPSHFWQYRVSNVTGGSLEFTRCAPHVIPLSRSV